MSKDDAPHAAPQLPLWCVERVLYDQEGLLVVDKPAGLPVHGGDEELKDDCVSRLSAWRSAQGRPSALYVHQRLDQGTSGVLFFLTDASRNAEFAHAMEQHQIERRYLAVVERAVGNEEPPQRGVHPGRPERSRRTQAGRGDRNLKRNPARRDDFFVGGAQAGKNARPPASGSSPSERFFEGTLELHLSFERGRAQVVPATAPGAKQAISHVRVLEQRARRALCEVKLSTGRPHQIRASLAHLGTPVVGDALYGGAPHERVLLHAASISGAPLPRSFAAPVPAEFARALTGVLGAAPASPGLDEIDARLKDAALLRARLAEHTSVFRLVNGAPDGLPDCTVDVYGDFATINPYAVHWDPATLRHGAKTLSELGFSGVYVKERVRADLRKQNAHVLAPDEPVWGTRAPAQLVVDEYGMKLGIELHDGLSTGLFVDMREARRKMRGWAGEYPAPRMLNLFCYTCSFSVAAALGGARTTSVDLSARALARGRHNFALNGLEPGAHRFFKEDALKFLSKSARRGDQYELIVLDPPSFATVGKGTFSVAEQYQQAARDCFALLAPGGRLLCVTNHQKTSSRALFRLVQEAAEQAGRELASIRSLPSGRDCPDHRSGPFPSKAVLAQVSGK
jgi:23S rRNA (cytosine1962-C5)-methyltransferase